MNRVILTLTVLSFLHLGCGATSRSDLETRNILREPSESRADAPATERTLRRIDIGSGEQPAEHNSGLEEVFLMPVTTPEVTSAFGMREDPIDPRRTRMHRGLDLRGTSRTHVYATASGQVLMAGYCDRGTGNCVVIEHAFGWRSQYFHLSAVTARAGEHVVAGEHIGNVGATGRATGPHLHFQLGRDGEAVDPMHWIGQPLRLEIVGDSQ